MARQLLDKARWFDQFSDSFKDDIANLMSPIDASPGHIFMKEGDVITHFFIVETGSLIRTKLPSETKEGYSSSAITIDEIGPFMATGFMHVVGRQSGVAFATVAAGLSGAKVWTVGPEFDDLLRAKPEYSMETIVVLTTFLRHEMNISRAVIRHSAHEDSSSGSMGANVLKVLCYDTTSWVKENFEPKINEFNESQKDVIIKMNYTQDRLDVNTAHYAVGYNAVCLFVNDTANSDVIQILSMGGVKLIAMRCAGFDRVDLNAAKTFAIDVVRVPAYSPYAVAEHAIALLMSVNRKIHAANARVKMANFTLDSGLLGLDIHGKKVGVLGTGKIGQILCRIITGFGANLLAFDVFQSDEVKAMGGKYVSQEEIFKTCDIIFLMMPLLPATRHTFNANVLPLLKKGVIIINTSRGALIDTSALIDGIQREIIGGVGLDVYENEGDYFFQDWSAKSINDSTLVALLGNNKVVMTAHQAFFTREAIDAIVSTTVKNMNEFSSGLRGKDLTNGIH